MAEGGAILCDQVGYLPARQGKRAPVNRGARGAGADPDRDGMRILTNDLTAPAQEIADLYKRRWAMSVFAGSSRP